MAHHTLKGGYGDLAERLNRFPQGAPPTELLFKILRILLQEREAALVAQLPIRPFTAPRAAEVWNMAEAEARKILEGLADRALLLDYVAEGETRYVLPPPMAGFFEFSLMRVRHDIDQKALSELFYQYLNVEEDFVRELFARGETQLGRVFVHETALPEGDVLAGPGLRARQRGGPARSRHRGRRLLLPPQDGPPGAGLRRAHGHLHDLRHGRRLPHAPRRGEEDRCGRVSRPPGGGAGARSRPVRRKRPGGGELHLQLLRVLLRGHDRRQALRPPPPRPHDQLPPISGRRRLQRLRQVREGLPRGGPGARGRPRPPATFGQEGPAARRLLPGLRGLRGSLPEWGPSP